MAACAGGEQASFATGVFYRPTLESLLNKIVYPIYVVFLF